MNEFKINKAYKYRIYPTEDQEVLLVKHFGCSRWIYNQGLKLKEKSYKETGKSLSNYEILSYLPNLKEEYPWLKEVNSQSLQQSLIHLENGMKRFFKKLGRYPKSKKKKGKLSFTVPQHFKIENDKLYLPKFREGIKIVIDRKTKGKICSATISRVSSGKYFVSISTEQMIEVKENPIEKSTSIGIDLGLKDLIITSNGKKIERKEFTKRGEKKLRTLQKKLSRQIKWSNTWKKTVKRIAIAYERIENKRKDYLHKVTRQLVNGNQVYTYCVEDLNVQGMMKNHKLAKSIADVSWYEFVRQLSYKALWAGKHVINIGRFEPSTKTCSICGNINNELTLKDREWVCDECSSIHDRDINATINIRNFAFAS